MNEQDIREEVIAPLIARLGYHSGTLDNIIREQSLRYPRAFIGRKDLKKDPVLRGKADYILEARSLVRWVIEAKAPDVEIGLDAVEQAYTYANHPEVRALYFVLCNGKKWMVFQTNLAPDQPPVLSLTYEELESNYSQIHNLLSPDSLIRDNPRAEPDKGCPIGEGLRSVVRIANGKVSYLNNSMNFRSVNEVQITVSGGAIERDEQNRLVAFLVTLNPVRAMQEQSERLGLASFEMYSEDSVFSKDITKPTIFRNQQAVIFPKGEKLFDINSWEEYELLDNMSCFVSNEASGCLEKNSFSGKFVSMMDFNDIGKLIRLEGEFTITLA